MATRADEATFQLKVEAQMTPAQWSTAFPPIDGYGPSTSRSSIQEALPWPLQYIKPMGSAFNDAPPTVTEGGGLEVPDHEHFACSKINNTYLPTGAKTTGEADAQRSGLKVDLEVDLTNHPLLYAALRLNPRPDGIKHVEVEYPPNFERLVRIVPESDRGDKKSSSGRPKKGLAWMDYDKGKRGLGLCSCGRLFQGSRGKLEHCRYKGSHKESRCVVVRLQKNRSRCFFCDTPITPSTNHRNIERHTMHCSALKELKKLIQKEHLEDHGLLSAEIHSFDWPARPPTSNHLPPL